MPVVVSTTWETWKSAAAVASDPELSPAAEPEGHGAARRHLRVTGI
jgi:hypothetical protein